MRHKAVWEGKTDGVMAPPVMKERLLAARAQAAGELNQRRAK